MADETAKTSAHVDAVRGIFNKHTLNALYGMVTTASLFIALLGWHEASIANVVPETPPAPSASPETPAVAPATVAAPAAAPKAEVDVDPVTAPITQKEIDDGILKGPQGSEVEEPKPVAKPVTPEAPKSPAEPEVPKVKTVSQDAYIQAKLNLGGVDTDGDGIKDGIAAPVSESPIEATPERSKKLMNLLHERGIDVTEQQAAEILKNGGYSVDGRQFELWTSKASGTFLTIEKPGVEYAQVSGTPVVESTELQKPKAEVTDVTRSELSNATIVVKDLPVSEFEGANPYTPGTPEYKAWADIHILLASQPDKLNDWQNSSEPVDTYLAKKGYTPSYPTWPSK